MFTPQNMFDKKGKIIYNTEKIFQLKSEEAKMLHRLFFLFFFYKLKPNSVVVYRI